MVPFFFRRIVLNMKKRKYCVIDEEYWEAVSELDYRIPSFKKYKEKNEFKPFFETLFEVDDLCYVACLSSKKRKHYRMKPSFDFLKVFIETSIKRKKTVSNDSPIMRKRFFVAVVNLNNMFPVPKGLIKYIDFKDIDQYRDFDDEEDKQKYITLLKKESKSLNKLKISEKAEKLYNIVCNYPDDNQALVQRTVDFKKIEEFAKEYISK